MSIYEHVVAAVEPGTLAAVLDTASGRGRQAVEAAGGRLFGLWKPLIGLSFNHVVAVVEWPSADAPGTAAGMLLAGASGAKIVQNDLWIATLRPQPGAVARQEPGFVTHRWYDIDADGLDRFLELSANTWANWEGTHDSQVQGLWRSQTIPGPGLIRMRLMAWYASMDVWERSRHWKGTKGAETANANLTQRYDMTRDSAVSILQAVGF